MSSKIRDRFRVLGGGKGVKVKGKLKGSRDGRNVQTLGARVRPDRPC